MLILKQGSLCVGATNAQQQLLQLRDHQGNTALHLAAMEGLIESVQLLLQAGAPINLPGQCLLMHFYGNVWHMSDFHS